MDPISQLFFLRERSLAMRAKECLAAPAAEPVVNSQRAPAPTQAFACSIEEGITWALMASTSALQAP